MAVMSQTKYNIYPNITITNGGIASGTISNASISSGAITGSTYTLNTGAGIGGTINGNAYTYTSPNSNFYSSNHKPIMSIPHGEEKMILEKEATLEVKGTLKINGVDLEERLSTIEKVLQIPTRDVTMEAKYPKLAELYAQYMKELEKYKTWDRVKGDKE